MAAKKKAPVKSAARKPPVKKASGKAAAKKPASSKVPAKKAPAKKTAAKKTAAKKPAPKKAAPKPSTAKRTAPKKPVAKKETKPKSALAPVLEPVAAVTVAAVAAVVEPPAVPAEPTPAPLAEVKLSKKAAAQAAKAASTEAAILAAAEAEKEAPPAPMPATADGGTHYPERAAKVTVKPTELTLRVGDSAPDFTLAADDDTPVTLSGLRGRKVILYFYPRDNTPGCTLEARDFSSLLPEFEAKNAVVLGVSTDGTPSHRKFKNTCELSVKLLADEDAAVHKAYGVWREKNMYGRVMLGTARTTFLLDEKGRIARVWERVKVDDHAADVLGALA